MEPAIQLSLPLFGPPSFNDLLRRRAVHEVLSVVVNPRLKRGWQVKALPFSNKRQLSVPCCFNDATEEIKNRLVDWALLPLRPRGPREIAVRKQRSLLEKELWNYLESLPDAPRRTSRFNPDAFSCDSRGRVYDLREVFASVNAAYFNSTLSTLVRWGRPRSRMSYHTTKTDAKGTTINLITIAGAYNHPEVPRFAIEGIMYHEMLHIAIPPHKSNGRNVIHGRAFKTQEKKFRSYAEWRKWERETLPGLGRRAMRTPKRSFLQGLLHFCFI